MKVQESLIVILYCDKVSPINCVWCVGIDCVGVGFVDLVDVGHRVVVKAVFVHIKTWKIDPNHYFNLHAEEEKHIILLVFINVILRAKITRLSEE